MAATAEVTLTGGWQVVATAGECLVVPTGRDVTWAVTASATAPTFTSGNPCSYGAPASVTLAGTERMQVRGPAGGKILVTADAPV